MGRCLGISILISLFVAVGCARDPGEGRTGEGGSGGSAAGGSGGEGGYGEGGSGGGIGRVLFLQIRFEDLCPDDCRNIRVGWTRQLVASPIGSEGLLEDVEVTWGSLNEDLASVDAKGLVEGLAEGTARIRAIAEGKESRITFKVGSAQVARIEIEPSELELAVGETSTLSAKAYDLKGRPLPGAVISWSSTNPFLAEVEEPGVVRAVGQGAGWIAAFSDDGTPGHEGVSFLVATSDEPPLVGASFEALAVGGSHSCGLAQGQAYCWGRNEDGQLGRGFQSDPMEGFPVPGRSMQGDVRFTGLAASAGQCGLDLGGMGWCWGSNMGGALGLGERLNGTPSPVAMAGKRVFESISLGGDFGCGLEATGKAWCWGQNASGQLGIGTAGRDDLEHWERWEPAEVVDDHTFRQIQAGLDATCALDHVGKAWCWGSNEMGTLGSEGVEFSGTPLPVWGDRAYASLSLSSSHACALTEAGEAWCWGRNDFGQLGVEPTGDLNFAVFGPVKVAGSRRFRAIEAGGLFTCALDDGGAAWCWGNNESGQLGLKARHEVLATPAQVYGDLRFASISAKGNRTCGITTEGKAFCWGDNGSGALGIGYEGGVSAAPWPVAAPE